MNLSRLQLRRLLGTFLLALAGLTGALTLSGSVSAHHPVLASQTDRPCGDDAAWTATVTTNSDRDWDKDWQSRYQVDGLPLSDWSALTDDQVPYVFEVGPFDATVTSVTVRVESQWHLKSGGLSASAARSITIVRPDTWSCDDITVTPTTPTVTYDCVDNTLVITGADDTDSVDYTVTIDQAPNGDDSIWTVTITATPQPGYQFPPDATTNWTFTDTVNCDDITVTPTTPTVTYDCVDNTLVITGADDTDSVDYTVTIDQAPNGDDSIWTVTITATPQPGYQFPPDATTNWTFTDTVNCDDITVTPTTPTVTYDCVDNTLVITGADDTDSVDYTVTIDQAPNGDDSIWTVTITATPQPGYQFPPDATTNWTFTDTVNCDDITVTPTTPTVTYDCVDNTLVITGADDTDSVDYTVTIDQAPNGDDSIWTVTITATPQPGYQFPPDATTNWTFTDTVNCDDITVTPTTPTVTYDCVDNTLVITGADDTDSVDYTVTIDQAPNGDDSIWTVTITATPQPGYQFPPDATTNWTFTDTVNCDDITVPAPPQLICRLAPDRGLAIEASTSDTYSYEVTGELDLGEDEPYDVMVVAIPAPGYKFPANAVTEWNFTGVVMCQRSIVPTTTSSTTTSTTTTPTTTTTTSTTTTSSTTPGSTTTTSSTTPGSTTTTSSTTPGSTTTTSSTTPGSTTTTTTAGGTAVTGSSSTGLLLASASALTLLGVLLLLITGTPRPRSS